MTIDCSKRLPGPHSCSSLSRIVSISVSYYRLPFDERERVTNDQSAWQEFLDKIQSAYFQSMHAARRSSRIATRDDSIWRKTGIRSHICSPWSERVSSNNRQFFCRGCGSRDGFLQAADMEDFIVAQRFDLRFAQSDDGDGFADGVEHLKSVTRLLAGAASVVFHDGGDVAFAEFVLGQVRAQSDFGKQLVFHSLTMRALAGSFIRRPVASPEIVQVAWPVQGWLLALRISTASVRNGDPVCPSLQGRASGNSNVRHTSSLPIAIEHGGRRTSRHPVRCEGAWAAWASLD